MTKKRLSLFQPIDLTEGTCWKTIFLFSIPIIISYLLQQIYTISDAAIVGQTLAADEVAGVNDTSPIAFIFLQFAFGGSAGFCEFPPISPDFAIDKPLFPLYYKEWACVHHRSAT